MFFNEINFIRFQLISISQNRIKVIKIKRSGCAIPANRPYSISTWIETEREVERKRVREREEEVEGE